MPALILGLALSLWGFIACADSRVAQAAGQQAPPPTYRLVRVAIGPRGAEVQGQYRLDEERTKFNRLRDTQVIVYLQWEGPSGVHRLGARWRSPGGGSSTSSEFEYKARDRVFGAYWTLPITAGMPLGTWTLEATVDGLPSGSCTFEIVDDQPTPAVLSAAGRRCDNGRGAARGPLFGPLAGTQAALRGLRR